MNHNTLRRRITGSAVRDSKYYSSFMVILFIGRHTTLFSFMHLNFVSHFLLLSFFSLLTEPQKNSGTETAEKHTEKQGAVLSVVFKTMCFFFWLFVLFFHCINYS